MKTLSKKNIVIDQKTWSEYSVLLDYLTHQHNKMTGKYFQSGNANELIAYLKK